MELKYRYSESTIKPEPIEYTKNTVWLRKDIVEEKRTDTLEDGTSTTVAVYTYQEAKLSHEDFKTYSSQLSAINAVMGVNDSYNIKQLVQNGVDNGDNQLVLMEAMADLYDLIAMMLG